jgi:hypothetical protein
LKVDIEHIGDRTMVTQRPATHRNVALLLTLVLTASFALSAACNPAPVGPQAEIARVHTAAPTLVLM